jgi:hypothetical protein
MKKYRIRSWINNWLTKEPTQTDISTISSQLANLQRSVNDVKSVYHPSSPTVGLISNPNNNNILGSLSQLNVQSFSSDSLDQANSINLDKNKAIKFHVYKANGGMIIETQRSDPHNHKPITGLYVTTDSMDLGKELNNIITMELLK